MVITAPIMFLSFSSGLWTEPQSEGEVKHSLCPDRPLPRQQTQPGPPPVQERERQRRGDRDRGRCRVAGICPWSQRSGGEAEERFCQGGSGVWVSGRCNTHTHEHTVSRTLLDTLIWFVVLLLLLVLLQGWPGACLLLRGERALQAGDFLRGQLQPSVSGPV